MIRWIWNTSCLLLYLRLYNCQAEISENATKCPKRSQMKKANENRWGKREKELLHSAWRLIRACGQKRKRGCRKLWGTWNEMEAGRANLSPTARTALPKLGKPIRSPQCLRSDCSLFLHCSAPAAPRWSTSDSFRKNQEPRGPEMSPNAARSRLRSGTPRGPPVPWTATRQRRSRVSSPKSHLPIPTHRCAPSRVPDADVRSTLTAAAAAAAAESWNSPTPSPTARGRRAKPPLQPL